MPSPGHPEKWRDPSTKNIWNDPLCVQSAVSQALLPWEDAKSTYFSNQSYRFIPKQENRGINREISQIEQLCGLILGSIEKNSKLNPELADRHEVGDKSRTRNQTAEICTATSSEDPSTSARRRKQQSWELSLQIKLPPQSTKKKIEFSSSRRAARCPVISTGVCWKWYWVGYVRCTVRPNGKWWSPTPIFDKIKIKFIDCYR